MTEDVRGEAMKSETPRTQYKHVEKDGQARKRRRRRRTGSRDEKRVEKNHWRRELEV